MMERIEAQMIYKKTRETNTEELEAILHGMPTALLVNELKLRLAMCEGALERFAPGFVEDKLYKP